jgi:cytidine deaminase
VSESVTGGFRVEWVLGGEPEDLPAAEVLESLHTLATEVRLRAHALSSGFRVGAALLTASGEIVTGCNIEASNGSSVCAERVALGKAYSEGHTDFVAVCSIGDTEAPITPCGQCRQHLADVAPTMLVLMATTRERRLEVVRLDRLFPRSNYATGTASRPQQRPHRRDEVQPTER